MDGMPDWAVYGVPALIWIVALINWLKETAGLDSKWALPVATALGIIMGLALYFAELYPGVRIGLEIAIGALLIGLAASGYYSGTKAQVERNGKQ